LLPLSLFLSIFFYRALIALSSNAHSFWQRRSHPFFLYSLFTNFARIPPPVTPDPFLVPSLRIIPRLTRYVSVHYLPWRLPFSPVSPFRPSMPFHCYSFYYAIILVLLLPSFLVFLTLYLPPFSDSLELSPALRLGDFHFSPSCHPRSFASALCKVSAYPSVTAFVMYSTSIRPCPLEFFLYPDGCPAFLYLLLTYSLRELLVPFSSCPFYPSFLLLLASSSLWLQTLSICFNILRFLPALCPVVVFSDFFLLSRSSVISHFVICVLLMLPVRIRIIFIRYVYVPVTFRARIIISQEVKSRGKIA